jgi:hypothetical protein
MNRLIEVTHELKIWPGYFEEILKGNKTFELRENDRGFQTSDMLWLREFDPKTQAFTGRSLRKKVTYVLKGPAFGLASSFVIMSIADLK